MNSIPCLLLIDDDEIATFINTSLLKKMKVCDEVKSANNGKEGLAILQEIHKGNSQCPQLIFLDINMPVMDGFEFIQAFKLLNIPNKEQIRIVVLTSSENPEDKNKMEQLGIRYYITKPLVADKLQNLLEEIA